MWAAPSITYADGSIGLSSEEMVLYSTKLLKLLARFSIGTKLSKSYCLWMIGFKKFEQLDEEQVEDAVQEALDKVSEFYTSNEALIQAKKDIRKKLTDKYVPFIALANRPIDEQHQFNALLSDLSVESLICFNRKSVWLTNQGKTLVANNTKSYTRKMLGKVVTYVAQTASELIDDSNGTDSKGPR